MQMSRAIARLAAATGLALGLMACSPIYRDHGFAPSEAELSEILVGIDTRDSVAERVGPPALEGLMREEAWYYTASRWKTVGAFKPKEEERQVVAISFDARGVVSNIETFGLEGGQVVVLNRRVSDDNIKGVTFLRQLLGNIGNFNAGDVVDN